MWSVVWAFAWHCSHTYHDSHDNDVKRCRLEVNNAPRRGSDVDCCMSAAGGRFERLARSLRVRLSGYTRTGLTCQQSLHLNANISHTAQSANARWGIVDGSQGCWSLAVLGKRKRYESRLRHLSIGPAQKEDQDAVDCSRIRTAPASPSFSGSMQEPWCMSSPRVRTWEHIQTSRLCWSSLK